MSDRIFKLSDGGFVREPPGKYSVSVKTQRKPDQKRVWSVFYAKDSRELMTSWTTYRDEAIAWADIIADHGYCTSAREHPAVEWVQPCAT